MVKNKVQSPASKILMVWDGSNFPLLEQPRQLIKNKLAFDKLEHTEYPVIFILAELDWPEKVKNLYYGFELAKELRVTYFYKGAIVICSRKPSFDKRKIDLAKILDTPGTYFSVLPCDTFDLAEFKGIDVDLLDDINTSLFDKNQVWHNLLHDTDNLLPEIASKLENKTQIKDQVGKFFLSKLNEFGKQVVETRMEHYNQLMEAIMQEFYETIDKEGYKPQSLRNVLAIFKEQMYSCLPEPVTEDLVKEEKQTLKRWQVLYIDDQAYARESLIRGFARHGITCITASTGDEAFKILKEDEDGIFRISVVISDFRFYENGDSEKGKWQELQGYQILEKIATSRDYKSAYAYAMLTSKKGTIISKVKSKSNYVWFHKTDVLSGGEHSFNLFAQQIMKMGSEAFLKKFSIPAYGGWRNAINSKFDADFNYKYLYKLHIESADYEQAESEIYSKLIEFMNLNELPDGFTLAPSFNKKDQPQRMVQLFRDTILLYRRLFLKLKFVNKLTDDQIFSYFKPKYTPTNKIKDKKTESKKLHLSSEELAVSQRGDSIRALFYGNWGFQEKLDTLKKGESESFNQPAFKFLTEESGFMKELFPNSTMDLNLDDEIELTIFLDEIKKLTWSATTLSLLLEVKFKLENEKVVKTTEINELFDCLVSDLSHSPVLNMKFLATPYMDQFYNGELEELSVEMKGWLKGLLE